MHLFAPEVGLMGTSGIVGPCILQAAGAGYSFKLMKTDRVAVAFFGDGAVNNGAFHEGLNMAGIWKLPVLFVCENNQFATEVPFAYASASPSVAAAGAVYGMPGFEVDGNDVLAVYEAAAEAVAARPQRRRAHAPGMPDLPHPAPRRGHGRLHLPHPRRGRGVEGAVPDPSASAACDRSTTAWPSRPSSRRSKPRSTPPSPTPSGSPRTRPGPTPPRPRGSCLR